MRTKKNIPLTIIVVITCIFLLAIGFDISPYLRGPAPYPPEWQWPYLFVNTLDKVWVPGIVFVIQLVLITFILKQKETWISKNEKKVLCLFIFTGLLFQFAIIYFSRGGLAILIHRIINPDLNGYFTASLQITNISDFLKNYNNTVLSLPQHAQGHPPGAVLFYSLITFVSSLIPSPSVIQTLEPKHEDVRIIWNTLSSVEKKSALISTVLIPLMSYLVVMPLFYLGKVLYNQKVALTAVIFYLFIPNIILFSPLNDVFLALFPLTAFLLFLKALKQESNLLLFTSGGVFFVGLFFSISVLPLLLLFLLLYISNYKKEFFHKEVILKGFIFLAGLIVPVMLLFTLFEFNFFEMMHTLLTGLPESREYTTWLFYNGYDFFVFLGIPFSIITLLLMKQLFTQFLKRKFKTIDVFSLSFFCMFIVLIISGTVRGEVGRIWLPFVPFLVLCISQFLQKQYAMTNREIILLVSLQMLQILVMQEFWVPLW